MENTAHDSGLPNVAPVQTKPHTSNYTIQIMYTHSAQMSHINRDFFSMTVSSSSKAPHSRGIKIQDTKFLGQSTTHPLTLVARSAAQGYPTLAQDLPSSRILGFRMHGVSSVFTKSAVFVCAALFLKVCRYGFQLPIEVILLHLNRPWRIDRQAHVRQLV